MGFLPALIPQLLVSAMKTSRFTALLMLALGASAPAAVHAQPTQVRPLLEIVNPRNLGDSAQALAAAGVHIAEIRADQLSRDVRDDVEREFRLDLGDRLVGVARLSQRNIARDEFGWSGSLVGVPFSSINLVVDGGKVWGVVTIADTVYHIANVSPDDGLQFHVVQRQALTGLPSEDPPVRDTAAAEASTVQPAGGIPDQRDDTEASSEANDAEELAVCPPVTLRVLVLYSGDAERANLDAGARSGAYIPFSRHAQFAVQDMNRALDASGVDHEVQLVGTERVEFPESGSLTVDLPRLREMGTTPGNPIFNLRQTHNADVVSLWVKRGNSCGRAYLPMEPARGSAMGFSVVRMDCVPSRYSFAHELGHNLGVDHDYANAQADGRQTRGVEDWSYGYSDPNGRYADIMGYPGDKRALYFSTPDVTARIVRPDGTVIEGPIGTRTPPPPGAMAATTLSKTICYAARWRPSIVRNVR
jgi:hypothetical protein